MIGKTIFLAFAGDPLFKTVRRTPVRLALCDIDEAETTQRNDQVLQIFLELPKFGGSLQEINEHTPFLEKLSYVFMEMADCKEIPSNLHDPLLERIFNAADTAKMKKDTKESYMKSILGEAEYEANLEDWKEEGLAEGRAEGIQEGANAKSYEIALALKKAGIDTSIISSSTGLPEDEILSLK